VGVFNLLVYRVSNANITAIQMTPNAAVRINLVTEDGISPLWRFGPKGRMTAKKKYDSPTISTHATATISIRP
jgi:hypothetical protein